MGKSFSRQQRRLLTMTAVGGFLEFYDFIIYALMASYLAGHFFPEAQTRTGLLVTFSTFASGYLVRPLGGIMFGHFGDRRGRKKTFSSTILLMAIATGLMGVLPGYHTIGMAAPVLLVTLRLLQGLALGGEIPGSITYLSESVPHRQGLVVGTVFMALIGGAVFGSLVHVLLGLSLDQQALSEWGWRLAFIFGGLVGVLGFYLRRNFQESEVFRALLEHQQQEAVPAVTLLREYPLGVLQGFAQILPAAVIMPLVFLFLPNWLVTVMAYDPATVRWMTLAGLTVGSFCALLWGGLADNYSDRTLAISLGASLLLAGIPFMLLIFSGGILYMAGIILCGVLLGLAAGFGPVQLCRLFPVSVRYSGVALSYNMAFAIVGGVIPLASLGLINVMGELYGSALLILAAGAIVLMTVFLGRYNLQSTARSP